MDDKERLASPVLLVALLAEHRALHDYLVSFFYPDLRNPARTYSDLVDAHDKVASYWGSDGRDDDDDHG